MDAATPDDFYEKLPQFRDFTGVMDPSRFEPLPEFSGVPQGVPQTLP